VDVNRRRGQHLRPACVSGRGHQCGTADAKQGDIFEPSAANALRGIVADALSEVDVEWMLQGLYEECEMPAGYRPEVNTGYPPWATHEMPFVLVSALPALPAGIQYRSSITICCCGTSMRI
jgi:hypothetical protein